jgi:hypothetical protein
MRISKRVSNFEKMKDNAKRDFKKSQLRRVEKYLDMKEILSNIY